MAAKMTPEKFIAFIMQHASPAQVETLKAKIADGWHPFQTGGVVGNMIVYCSKPRYAGSNIALNKDYCRVLSTGGVVNYDPQQYKRAGRR